MKGIIYIEARKCLGCKTCEIECAVFHSKTKTLAGACSETSALPRLKVEEIASISVPLQCCHCDSAPCVSACPTGAISKDKETGAITISQELCVGCKSCILVCPYGVPEEKKGGKVIIKCDLCFENLKKGGLPVCVKGCPTKAIKFVEIIEAK